jgi:hypothetical protein
MKPPKPISMRIDFDPVANRRTVKIPPGAIACSVATLCRRAGIPIRATVLRDVYVYRGRRKVRTPMFDLVGVPDDPRSRVGAMRALESLAYSFFDHAARYCVCKRGYFVP